MLKIFDKSGWWLCLRGPSSFPAGPAATLSAVTTTFINQDWNNPYFNHYSCGWIFNDFLQHPYTSPKPIHEYLRPPSKSVARKGEGKRTIRCEKRWGRSGSYLWHEYEAQCAGRTENDEDWDEDEGGVGVLIEDCGDGDTQDTHDRHIIHGHTHIPANTDFIKYCKCPI